MFKATNLRYKYPRNKEDTIIDKQAKNAFPG